MKRWRRWLRNAGLLAAALVCLGAVVILIYRFRAQAAWERYRVAAIARGEKLSLADYRPPEIPPEENYAAGTIFERHVPKVQSDGTESDPLALPEAKNWKGDADTADGRLVRAAAGVIEAGWFDTAEIPAEPALTVLKALERFEPLLMEMRRNRDRRGCRFPQDLTAPPRTSFPSLQLLLSASKLWALRMHAHLAIGKPHEAIEDWRDGMRLFRGSVSEPTLIAGLVRSAGLKESLRAVDAGISAGRWSADQLQEIATTLEGVDLKIDARHAFSSERGFLNDAVATMRGWSIFEQANAVAETDLIHEEPHGLRLLVELMAGRSWREQLRSNEAIDLHLTKIERDYLPATWEAIAILGGQAPEVYAGASRRYFFLEIARRQTCLAAQIERHRLNHGSFPETLDVVLADFRPETTMDPMSGKPMRYIPPTADAPFRLYSVGPNERDDGGSSDSEPGAARGRRPLDLVWAKPWQF